MGERIKRTTGTHTAIDPAVIGEFLGSTALFRDATREVIDAVAPHVLAFQYQRGEQIIAAGSSDAQVGVLFAGRAIIRLADQSAGTTPLQELRIGDHFGEIPSLLGTAQPYEVIADDACTAILLRGDVVGQLSERVATFPRALARGLAKRMLQWGTSGLSAPMANLDSTSAPTRLARGSAGPPDTVATAATQIAPIADDGAPHYVRTAAYDITEDLLRLIPLQIVSRLRVLPLRLHEKTLTVGMVDPFNGAAVGHIQRMLPSVSINVVAIATEDYNSQLARLQINAVEKRNPADRIPPGSLIFDKEDSEREAEKALRVVGDEVVNLSQRVLAAALDCGASDIHIEEKASAMKVRFRVHGDLHDWEQYIPGNYAKPLIARFKVLAGLDITERRLPQDGRIAIKIGNRDVDLRISTMPTSRGEKAVFRIFEGATCMMPLEKIFLEQRTLNAVREAINRRHGCIFVAGPTGSGKSSTLYACIHAINRAYPEKNVCMVEDPMEYRLQDVTQVQVNHAVKFDFHEVLRGLMRQDPDVIMVGEVRDGATAQAVLEASLTGHLVLTSTHSHEVFAALQRLEKLGCSRMVLAQSLSLMMVQKLIRRVCPACVVMEEPAAIIRDSLIESGLLKTGGSTPLPVAKGCDRCAQTGFSGRVAVVETLLINETLRGALISGAPLSEVKKIAESENLLITSRQYAVFLMASRMITPGDALVTITA